MSFALFQELWVLHGLAKQSVTTFARATYIETELGSLQRKTETSLLQKMKSGKKYCGDLCNLPYWYAAFHNRSSFLGHAD